MIFAGNPFNSGTLFALPKKIVGIMDGAQARTSCGSLFKQMEILLVSGQYILSLIKFIINNNQENF
jgi:hypothetical protein